MKDSQCAINVNHLTKTFKSGKDGKLIQALDGLSFELKKGDSMALVGPNGAGKSTLLKVLSGITNPTSGTIEVRGKVISLLELGTGFHPELTGKENVYFYGGINGYSKSFMASIMDTIFEFSGVSEFRDLPVKNYSSGMYIRLAFSTAIHLPFDILLLDEIMSVGDLEFRKMVIQTVGKLRQSADKTIITVSHNLSSLLHLTDSALWLQGGKKMFLGDTQEVVSKYIQGSISSKPVDENSQFSISNMEISNPIENLQTAKSPLEFKFDVNSDIDVQNISIRLVIKDEQNRVMAILNSELQGKKYKIIAHKVTKISCQVPAIPFLTGSYFVDISIYHHLEEVYSWPFAHHFVVDNTSLGYLEPLVKDGIFLIPKWD